MARQKKAAVTSTKLPGIKNLPKVGDRRPGGVVGAIMLGDGKRPGYLIIVANAKVGEAQSLAWGGCGTEIKSLSDWDGLANTKKLVKNKADHPAAQFCADLVIDGCNDFYLPARHEARLLFASAKRLFDPSWHWTSTQHSSYGAFSQFFDDGSQCNDDESNEGRVRAVRRIIIN